MSESILGVDIAKQKFEVALLVEGKIKNKSFPNTTEGFKTLALWSKKRGIRQIAVCLEATGNYGEDLALIPAEDGRNKHWGNFLSNFFAESGPGLWVSPDPKIGLIQEDHFFIYRQGITAFRISTQGKVLEKAYFDTNGSIPGTLDLVSRLKKFSDEEYLALVVHDEGSHALIPEVSDLLRTFGAKNPLTKGDWCQSYCFLGKKGNSKKEAFEFHTVSSPSVLHSPSQFIEISDIRLNLP